MPGSATFCFSIGRSCAPILAPGTFRQNRAGHSRLNHQTNTSRRVPRRMQYSRRKPAKTHRIALFHEILNARHRRRRHSQPLRLNIQMFIQLHIRLVNHHRRAGRAMQFGEPAHMINMCMRAHDGP